VIAAELLDRIGIVEHPRLDEAEVIGLAWREVLAHRPTWIAADFVVEFLFFVRKWRTDRSASADWACSFIHRDPDRIRNHHPVVVLDDETGNIVKTFI
jgi:hypothetical protein